MNKQEKQILKAIIEHPKGLLSPATVINGIAKKDQRSVEKLVSMGYIKEVPREHRDVQGGYYTINFYRPTEKGLSIFLPYYKRFWISIKGDIRTIFVSAITALITTAIAFYITKILGQ